MIKIVIHTDEGDTTILTNVVELKFVKLCPYLEDHEFITTDPTQRFCRPAHRAHYYRKHKVAPAIPADRSNLTKTPA